MGKMKILLIAVIIQGALVHGYRDMKKCSNSIDGEWGEWREWSPCSSSCGRGYKKRVRYCVNPRPQYGGSQCTGPDIETEKCHMGLCPVDGEHSGWKYTKCTKPCDGGTRIKYKECHPPKDKKGLCYKSCTNVREMEQCNTHACEACHYCKDKAEAHAARTGVKNFVGHACRADKKYCAGLTGGIKEMYPSNHWFFLHCSADGPWCKPCATRGLVYNAKCGQCELTADGACTGPGHWRKTIQTEASATKSDSFDEMGGEQETYEDHPPETDYNNPCRSCEWRAKRDAELRGDENFVGYPCRTKQQYCMHKSGGINNTYPANHWFFLNCSTRGAWCKPCAKRNMAYNPRCGACGKTRDGPCKKEDKVLPYHKREKNGNSGDDESW